MDGAWRSDRHAPRRRSARRAAFAGIAVAIGAATGIATAPASGQERIEPAPGAPVRVSPGALRGADRDWLVQLSQRTRTELAAAQLAQQRSTDEGVKQYAAAVAGDHQQIGDALRRFAAAKGVQLPTQGTRAQRTSLQTLQAQSGDAFDRRYASDFAVVAHRDTVRMLQSAADRVQDKDVKQLAQQLLPAIQQHLAMGESLRTREAGGDPRQPATKP